jgi:hypothetical protein
MQMPARELVGAFRVSPHGKFLPVSANPRSAGLIPVETPGSGGTMAATISFIGHSDGQWAPIEPVTRNYGSAKRKAQSQ